MADRNAGAVLRQALAQRQQRQRALGVLRAMAIAIGIATGWMVLMGGRAWLHSDALRGDALRGDAQSAPSVLLPLSSALSVSLLVLLAGALVGWIRTAWTEAQAARDLDGRVPTARNLLVTAQELLGRRENNGATQSGAEALVLTRADQLAATLDVNALVPPHRERRWLLWAAGGWLLALFLTREMPAARWVRTTLARTERSVVARATGRAAITAITAEVIPPAYTGRGARRVEDPTRLEVLAYSTVELRMRGIADSVRVTLPDSASDDLHPLDDPGAATPVRRRTIGPDRDGRFTIRFVAQRDGYLAVEPVRRGAPVGVRRVIGLSVRADEAPQVQVVTPARDLMVPDATRAQPVVIDATDDLGLTALQLRYTKVSGSGERFTFADGTLPLQLTRTNATHWRGQATLALDSLLKEPGDVVVVRGLARDARPGAAAVESDAVLIELVSPGGMAATGFSTDPDEDRSALSQQMVILKTERLLAARKTLSTEAVAAEAQQLAVEQRRVRAEFVFMMGGEFAQESSADEAGGDLNEAAETESEGDLAAGRMVNRGRVALLQAVRAMSRAAVALTAGELTPALAREKEALTQLQEAFARSRFLMRALSQREQLDPTRRLTGRMDSLGTGRETPPTGDRIASRAALRAVLAELLAVGSTSTAGASDRAAAQLAGLAERVLAADPSSSSSQAVAQALLEASRRDGARRRVAIDSAAAGLTRAIGRTLPASARSDEPPGWRGLSGLRGARR